MVKAYQYDDIKRHLKHYQEREQEFKSVSEYLSSEEEKALSNEMYDTSQDIDFALQLNTAESHEKTLRDQLEFEEYKLQRMLTEFFQYIEDPEK